MNFRWAVFAAVGVILSACYMLWLFQRVILRRALGGTADAFHMPDLNGREWARLAPLLLMMVWMGIAPQTFLPPVSASNRATLERSRVNLEQTVKARAGQSRRVPVREVAHAR